MKEYIILVETGADTTKAQQEEYGFVTVPMHVFFGDELRDDGTFDPAEEYDFYKKTGVLPKSCGSNVEDFEKVYDEVHAKHPNAHILHIAYSAITTVSYQSGVMAAEGRDYITSYDTKQVSAGQAMVAVLTARYIRENPDAEVDEIMAQVADYSERVHMGFVPGDLEYLRAGGRVSNAAYIGAKILSIKPLIEIKDGVLTGTKKYRGSASKINSRILTDMTAEYNFSKDILFFVYAPGLTQELMDEVEAQAKQMGYKEIQWVMTGGVVTSHSGPGGFGVIGLSEK